MKEVPVTTREEDCYNQEGELLRNITAPTQHCAKWHTNESAHATHCGGICAATPAANAQTTRPVPIIIVQPTATTHATKNTVSTSKTTFFQCHQALKHQDLPQMKWVIPKDPHHQDVTMRQLLELPMI